MGVPQLPARQQARAVAKFSIALGFATLLIALVAFLATGGSDVIGFVLTQRLRKCLAPCSYSPSWLTLGQIVDAYGPPDRVAAYPVIRDETPIFAVDVFYLSQGLSIRSFQYTADYAPRRDFMVIEVAFWESTSLADLVHEIQGRDELLALELEYALPWSGFGTIEPLPRSRPTTSPTIRP